VKGALMRDLLESDEREVADSVREEKRRLHL
jgi:hypothetical protein